MHLSFSPLANCTCQLYIWTLLLSPNLIDLLFNEHTLKFWCNNTLMIWQCSHLTPIQLLGTPSTWWCSASLLHWTALKIYIVPKFYSWMAFLMPTCNSQGKPGVFPETPSHQITEFLKRSTKCLHNLLYIHHQ